MEKINSTEGKKLFEEYKPERLKRFYKLIEKNPKLKAFKKGWENRVNLFKYDYKANTQQSKSETKKE